MATIITGLILAFVAGVIVGVLLHDKLTKVVEEEAAKALDLNRDDKLDLKDAQLGLDLNNDGKVDSKDLDIAKAELKKTATQINKLAKKVN